MKRGTASLVNIPGGEAFLDCLAAELITADSDPLALTQTLILLPTRRACRAMQEAFLRSRDGEATILPRIQPLGEPDPTDIDFALYDAGDDGILNGALDIPPAISPVRRQVLLSRLITAWRPTLPLDQALRLAQELARLMDEVWIEGVDFTQLRHLVPEDFAAHWQITLDFLTILTEHWPKILATEGALDPADRRSRLLLAQAEAWRNNPPQHPIIVAGTTGSIPATAELLSVIHSLPQGLIVLAGLDHHALSQDLEHILAEPAHPQHSLARLLQKLNIAAEDVPDWPEKHPDKEPRTRPRQARALLLQETFRPAPATERWRDLQNHDADLRPALEGLTRIDCPGSEEEASVIALLMRETLETPSKTAALITPDRSLARRVSAALRRWSLSVDDSAGQPLAATPVGALLRLSAATLSEQLPPVELLAVLKHPLAAGGTSVGNFKTAVRRFERDVLRGPRPAAGIKGLTTALDAAKIDPAKKLIHQSFLDNLSSWAAPFLRLQEQPKTSLVELVTAHLHFVEKLTTNETTAGAERLWLGDAGEIAQNFAAEILEAGPDLPELPAARYPALLDAFMTGRVVRPKWGTHPRLFVWGLLEARLQKADRVILSGLNEGTWPAEPLADPWMSRPMRRRMGLPPAERRIGQAAHDFAMASHNSEVYLTRAAKVDGTPTVPTRWLLRLDGVLTAARLNSGTGIRPLQDQRWLRWQGQLDAATETRRLAPPAPRPPYEARPRRLSVTEIETWRRDPYAIYARRILRLEKLDDLDAELMANTYGTLVHDILDRFLRLYPIALPPDAETNLMAMGEQVFGAETGRPKVWGFWRPRFQRIAHWFVREEQKRRIKIKKIHSEIKGELVIKTGTKDFTLSAKVDRIDEFTSGSLAIIDYKTGTPPTARTVEAGFAPQLSLEAAMVAHGAFSKQHGIPAGSSVDELAFWHLSGRKDGGQIISAVTKNATPTLVANDALEGLRSLIAIFDDPNTPYLARPYPSFAPKYSDYTHLSRMDEWSLAEDESET